MVGLLLGLGTDVLSRFVPRPEHYFPAIVSSSSKDSTASTDI